MTETKTEHCACGRPKLHDLHALAHSPIRAEIMQRLDMIRKRRIELVEELGRLVRDEQDLRARLARLAHEN